MDLYSLEKLSEQRIKHFHQEAEHNRLVHEARDDRERSLRAPAWINLVALLALVVRVTGSGLK